MIGHVGPFAGGIHRQGRIRIAGPSAARLSAVRLETALVDPVGEPEQQPAGEQESGELQEVGEEHASIPRHAGDDGHEFDAMGPPSGRILTPS
jgi:hypothetical protein